MWSWGEKLTLTETDGVLNIFVKNDSKIILDEKHNIIRIIEDNKLVSEIVIEGVLEVTEQSC